jgi:hypothetical protein
MDFSMTVRTKQHTFIQFALQAFPPVSMIAADHKILLAGIEMMKVQGFDAPIVTAQATGSSFVLDSLELDIDSFVVHVTGVTVCSGVAFSVRPFVDIMPPTRNTDDFVIRVFFSYLQSGRVMPTKWRTLQTVFTAIQDTDFPLNHHPVGKRRLAFAAYRHS